MRRAGLWRAGELSAEAGLPTGHAALDALLPGRGWPRVGLTELLAPAVGIGALRLVLPALATLAGGGAWVVWVAPPFVPYPPALRAQGLDLARVLIVDLPALPAAGEDGLWVCEQALRFTACGAALMWLDDVEPLWLRRLQLAAEAGRTWGLLFRPERHARQPSAAPCRLLLEPVPAATEELRVTLLKARGGRHGAHCQLVP